MNAYEIPKNTKLKFQIINNAGSFIGQSYSSELVDAESETDIIISCPPGESRLMFVPTGTMIRISVETDKEGELDFTAVITGKERNDTKTLIHARTGKDFKEIQRRNYFRPDCNLKAKYRQVKINSLSEEVPDDEPYINVKAINISSYGACIIAEEKVPLQSMVDVVIWLTEKYCVRMLCRIVRNTELIFGENKKYELGLSLEDMTFSDHKVLMKYITNNVTVKDRLLHWDEPDVF